jgi:adenylate cyclase
VASNRVERRLAAILSADMVGYSRLMEADEAGTIARQGIFRSELIDPKIAAYNGRIVKTTGDGMLVEFASAVDAVECAVDIQQAMGARQAEQTDEQRIQYRIGINVGDIVIDGDDILRDGVNVAARLEGLADAGSICISDDVMRQVRGKLDAAFDDGGDQKVKNITQAIHVWRWAGADSNAAAHAPQPVMESAMESAADGNMDLSLKALIDAIEQPTLAVLLFLNMSRNEDLEFFCDDLTESLITDLSRALRITVPARNSSFAFKGQAIDIRVAAQKMGVRYLIEGSVQAMGARMRVKVQLIDSITGDHIWADRYDRSTDDLFTAQDELCSLILFETDAAISFGEAARYQKAQAMGADALLHARRAIHSYSQYDRVGFIKAQREADIAASLDPDLLVGPTFAVASRAQLVLHGWATDRDAVIEDALNICNDALLRNPDAAGILSNRGMIHLANRAFDLAIADTGRGMELLPGVGPTNHIHARALIAKGRFDEAFRAATTAIRLQPNVFSYFLLTLGFACLLGKRPADAVLVFRKFCEMAPHLTQGIAMLAAALRANGQRDEAENVAAAVMKIDPNLTIEDVLCPYPMEDPAPGEILAGYLTDAGLPNPGAVSS